MKKALRLTTTVAFGLALVVCFFFLVQNGAAQIAPDPPVPPSKDQPQPLSLGAFNNPASPQSPLSIAGS